MFDLLNTLVRKVDNQYLIFITIIITLISVIFKKNIQQGIKRLTYSRTSKSDIKVSALIDHDIFSTFSRVVNEVHNMRFYTSNKYDKTKSIMCYELILKKQTEMHKDYVKEIRGLWLSKGIAPSSVDHVVSLFEGFRFPVIRSFEHRISAIFGSSFHPNNFERILAVFDMWSMGIDLLPNDMNTTFETLNGKFKDIDYN